ncbi:MAG: LPS biosynthesis glycosyltransferase [Leptolyngbya sp.]|nr:LPS biosynthesis glycosyltransferase [Leptolyngbya sp.]
MDAALSPSTLAQCIGQTFILAYKEDTTVLASALEQAGLPSQVVRQVHQPGYDTYARSYLCLLNHRAAWERAAQAQQPSLIVEADFVPVRHMGALPPSFDPQDDTLGIAWLYTCAPQVYRITDQGYGEGYSTAMVAYVITPRSAQAMVDYADQIAADPGPTAYSPWDSGLDYYLRDRGFLNYVPFRNYGEHGGISNPEHRNYVHRQRRLSGAHRADVLYGPLCFLPPYAQTHAGTFSRWDYFQGRLYGRIKGLGRLLLGKYLRVPVLRSADRPLLLAWFALRRQLTLRP